MNTQILTQEEHLYISTTHKNPTMHYSKPQSSTPPRIEPIKCIEPNDPICNDPMIHSGYEVPTQHTVSSEAHTCSVSRKIRSKNKNIKKLSKEP
jgi:hypothetical protein